MFATTVVGSEARNGSQYGVWDGEGGCAPANDDKDEVRGVGSICAPQTGFVKINDWYRLADNTDLSRTFTFVHELGHVLGLDHPNRNNCAGTETSEENRCVGPVMSYGTCPYSDNTACRNLDPNEDDRAGIRQIYYGSSTSSGGACLAELLAAPPGGSDELALSRPGEVIRVTIEPGEIAGDVPDLQALSIPLPSGSGIVSPGFALKPDTVTQLAEAVADTVKMVASEPVVDVTSNAIATSGKAWKTAEKGLELLGVPDPTSNCL